MFVPSFLALWWPKIDRKSGFPQLHHIILDGVIVVLDCMFLWFSYKFALLWQIFLRFPNFLYQLQPRYLPYHDTLVGRVMPKFFSNKFFLNDSHQCSYHNDLKIGLFVGYFLMGWVLIRAGVYCPHLWAQLVIFMATDAVAPSHQVSNSDIDCLKCGYSYYSLVVNYYYLRCFRLEKYSEMQGYFYVLSEKFITNMSMA